LKLTITKIELKRKEKINTMKLSLTFAPIATLLLLSAFVQAKQKTTALHRGLKGGNNIGDNYFALISVAREATGCMPSALGSVIATVREDTFCIKLSYDGLSGQEHFSHVHGPAAVGDTGPVIFTINTSTAKMQCFELTKDQKKALDDELWYINIHSEMCPNGTIRGQFLPLLSNVRYIVTQLRQTAEAVTEALI
jgi:hypothetical protein